MTEKSSNGDDAPKTGDAYSSPVKPVVSALYIVGFLNVLYTACVEAYNIRLYAINEYGRVIHEFDPYFNYRAAEVSFFGEKIAPYVVETIYCPNVTISL
jgi:hypothetical protein